METILQLLPVEPTEEEKIRLDQVNQCRLFLQVTYLSEIVSNNGQEIMQEALTGRLQANQSPVAWKIHKSKLKWPNQPRPK